MSRSIILLILLGITTMMVIADDEFFGEFGDFIDGIVGLIESSDFGSSHSFNNNNHRNRDNNFLNMYLWILIIDSFYTPGYGTIPASNIILHRLYQLCIIISHCYIYFIRSHEEQNN